jgi:cupin 2 domain-containing protein
LNSGENDGRGKIKGRQAFSHYDHLAFYANVGPSDSLSVEVLPMQNIFNNLPAKLPQELVQTLRISPHIRIERIVSHGHTSAVDSWFDQDWNEWVILLRGAARLQFEGDAEAFELEPGSFIDIPAHKRHRVEWTDPDQPTVWLAIHYA